MHVSRATGRTKMTAAVRRRWGQVSRVERDQLEAAEGAEAGSQIGTPFAQQNAPRGAETTTLAVATPTRQRKGNKDSTDVGVLTSSVTAQAPLTLPARTRKVLEV